MANQYDSWVPSAPVKLPMDAYIQAAGIAEQKGQQYQDELGQVFGAYGSVDPFSPNAQAVYDKAMGKLKTDVAGVAKMNLKTPEAYRKFMAAASGPETGKQIMGVFKDTMYAQQAQQALSKYLETNPENNTVDYMQAFTKARSEKAEGDAAAFDPNRFRNLGAVPDYYDYWDKVAAEVKSLKEDSNTLQRIMGDKYKLYEKTGVLPERIQDIAMQKVLNDPKARAQFQRDIKYRAYLTNPNDIQGGYKQMATDYRSAIGEQIASKGIQFDDVLKKIQDAKTNPRTGKLYTQAEKKKDTSDITVSRDRVLGEMIRMGAQDDDKLIMESALNAFAGSFKSYSNTKIVDKEWFNPMAVARYSADQAMRRLKMQMDAKKKDMADMFGQHTTLPGLLNQTDLSQDKIQDWAKERLKEDLPITSQLVNGDGRFDPASGYMPAAKIMTADERKAHKDGKKPAEFMEFGNLDVPKQNGTIKETHVKNVYAKASQEIKDYLIKKGFGLKEYSNAKGEFDPQKGLNAIISHKRAVESAFMTPHTFPGGNTNEFKDRVKNLFGSQPIYDENNVEIKPNDLVSDGSSTRSFRDMFEKDKPVINGTPSDFKTKTPMFVFTMNGKTYRTAMDAENQAVLRNSSEMINNTLLGKAGATSYNGDLVVNKMTGNGEFTGMVIPGGASSIYQSKAQEMYNANIAQLVKETGMNALEANQYLRDNYRAIDKTVSKGQSFVATNPDNKKTTKLNFAAFSEIDGTYYYSSQIPGLRMQNGKIGPAKIMSIGEYIYSDMQDFGTNKNPYMDYYNRDLYSKKAFMSILGGTNFAETGDLNLSSALELFNDNN